MSRRKPAVRPGVVPAARPDAGTMVAALHGEFFPHPWRRPDSEHDAYQLFYQRSVAMGWLDDRSSGTVGEGSPRQASGLWAMNDADWGRQETAASAGLIAWFQISASAVADDRPLPVQPFLRCAEDAVARAGVLHLAAVQLLLPVGGLDPSLRPRHAPVPSLLSRDWFAECDPAATTSVEVSISSGTEPSILAVADQLTGRLTAMEQQVYAHRSYGPADASAFLPVPFDDSLWNGPATHGILLRGELVEWSCDAVGWLAEIVADIASALGVRTPLRVTVAKAAGVAS